MNYNNFIDYKLDNINNLKLFQELKKIYNNNNILNKTKQRKVEKLMNVFNLNSKENLFELNPFWSNLIYENFSKELEIFDLAFNKMPNVYKDIKNKNNTINNFYEIFTSYEIFNIIIYSFLKDIEDNSLKQKNILLKDIVTNINLFYDHKFKLEFLKMNKKNYLELKDQNYEEFISKITNRYKEIKKDFTLTYEIVILEFLKEEVYLIDKRYIKFKNIKERFLKDFDQEKEYNYIILHRLFEYIFDYIIFNKKEYNLNIFESFIGKLGKKSYDYMYITNLNIYNNLNSTTYLLSLIPMIVPPRDWNYKGRLGGYLNNIHDIIPLVKGINRGKSSIKMDKYFIDSINLIQKKEYKINKKFLNYIKTPLFKKEEGILSYLELYELYLKMLRNKNIIEKVDINIYLKELLSLQSSKEYKIEKNLEIRNKKINDLKNFYNIKDEDIFAYKNYKDSREIYYKNYNKFKEYNLIINYADLLIDFKIYAPNKSDWRGRLYPILKILHRASGIYKNLLIDFNEYTDFDTKNNHDYFNILKEFITVCYKPKFMLNSNYYTKNYIWNWFDNNIYKNLKRYSFEDLYNILEDIINNNNNEQDLLLDNNIIKKGKYFELLNLINDSKDKHLFLFSLKEYYYIKSGKGSISFLSLDLDQSSSGPMIYSMLSKDKKMATLTNLFSENKKMDLYNHFLNIFLKDINKYLFIKDIDILKLFTRNDFAKLLLMPKFYNMGDKGIKKLLIKILNKNIIFSNKVYEEKIKIISSITKYINLILIKEYKNTIEFQDNLVQICKLIYDSEQDITFYTLDGSFIYYRYILLKQKFGSIKTTKFGKRKSYRINLPIDEKSNKLDKKHYLTFPPNVIQSIDGALCRIILNTYHKLIGSILEPLHDSFKVSIKNIIPLKNIIKYVYLYIFFNNFFHRKKLGINNNTKIIEYNSKYYNEYKNIFYYNHDNNNNTYDIINDLFIKSINLKKDNMKRILYLYKKNLNKEFKDTDIERIIKSDFFFYF